MVTAGKYVRLQTKQACTLLDASWMRRMPAKWHRADKRDGTSLAASRRDLLGC